LAGVIIGLVYLGTLFCIGSDHSPEDELALMLNFAGLTVAGFLAITRFLGCRIHAISVDGSKKTAVQFSIRQLMLLTLVVACLIAVAKSVEPHVDMRSDLVMAFLVGVPFVILGLVAVWAILGTKRPRLGIVLVSLLAPALGVGSAAVFGESESETGLWITATMTAALVLVVSLYVIRRCGFRVRRQPIDAPAFEGEGSQKE
jgi:hypothetical protein